MQFLVTGGAGFIGSHLSDALIEGGHSVLVLDDLSTGKKENVNPKAKLMHIDLVTGNLDRVFGAHSFDAVFHLAAQVSVSASVRAPVYDAKVNIIGTVRLLDCAVRSGVKKFVFASSGGTVYGDCSDERAWKESDPLKAGSPYGASKISAEQYIRVFHESGGLNYSILRYSNVYGPRQDPHGEAGVIAIFARAMLAGGTPTVFGDGSCVRDYIYVGDVVRANILAAEQEESRIYNIGTGNPVSTLEIHQCLAKECGYAHPPRFGPYRRGDLAYNRLDVSRAGAELSWEPEVSLEEGLRFTVDHFRGLND